MQVRREGVQVWEPGARLQHVVPRSPRSFSSPGRKVVIPQQAEPWNDSTPLLCLSLVGEHEDLHAAS